MANVETGLCAFIPNMDYGHRVLSLQIQPPDTNMILLQSDDSDGGSNL